MNATMYMLKEQTAETHLFSGKAPRGFLVPLEIATAFLGRWTMAEVPFKLLQQHVNHEGSCLFKNYSKYTKKVVSL